MSEEKRACVIGWPVSHSRSPFIHNYWIQKFGISGSYGREAVIAENFPQFLKSLRDKGYCGANVTVPHKEQAFKLADEVDDISKAMQAVNTLWIENDQLFATNTDCYGFLTHLDFSAEGWQNQSGSAVVLGAGGAARAVVYGLLSRGLDNIVLVNRTRQKAEDIAGLFGSEVTVYDWEDRSRVLAGAKLLVNSTSLGMTGAGQLDIDLKEMSRKATVMDIVYVPLVTKLLRDANQLGLRTVDGLGMLLHQAVPGFEKWFGLRPEVTSELRAKIVADLEA